MHDRQNARGGATGTELLALYIQPLRSALSSFTSESRTVKELCRLLQDRLWIAQHGQLSPLWFSERICSFGLYSFRTIKCCYWKIVVRNSVLFKHSSQLLLDISVFWAKVWSLFVRGWRTSATCVWVVSWDCPTCARGAMSSCRTELVQEDAVQCE